LTADTTNSSLNLRAACVEDEVGIAHVCLRTANSGKDASKLYSRPDLPALIWATPYLVNSPGHCFVVEQGAKVVGFIVTTPNTRDFEGWLQQEWMSETERRLDGFEPATEADTNAIAAINAMRQQTPSYADKFPAHLHINLLPEAQGTGFGRKLVTTALQKLKGEGVSAIHLGVSLKNLNAVGFYKTLGFTEIEQGGALILGKTL